MERRPSAGSITLKPSPFTVLLLVKIDQACCPYILLCDKWDKKE